MADTRISLLTDGGEPQNDDELASERGAASNVKLTWANVLSWLTDRFLSISGGQTLDGQGGFATTWRVESSGDFTPDPEVSNAVRISADATVSLPVNDGFVLFTVDNTVVVNVTAFDVRGTEGTGKRSALLIKDDSADTPQWHWLIAP